MNLSPQFKLRLSPELKVRVEEAAAANGRSINAEVNERLEDSFAIGNDLEVMGDRLNHLKALNRMIAFYLHEVVKRVPESDDPESNDLLKSVQKFAEHLSLDEPGRASDPRHAISTKVARGAARNFDAIVKKTLEGMLEATYEAHVSEFRRQPEQESGKQPV